MSPTLSVILPVYNAMPYLPDAVDSVLRQSFSDFSLIIINDGSTDGSLDYLQSLRDPRIVLVNQENQGLGSSLNLGLNMCQSQYVARMDADDISLPDRFASQIEFLEAHPRVVMVGTQIDFLIRNHTQKGLRTPTNHEEIQSRLIMGRAGLCHPSIMFRTPAAVVCGGYPTALIEPATDFLLRMCEQGPVANLDRVLLRYRLHAGQLSQTKCRELIAANLYAAYCAYCRRDRIISQPFDAFMHGQSFLSRCRLSIEAWELIQYRTARIELANGNRLRAYLRIVSLAVCRPLASIRRFVQVITWTLRSRHAQAEPQR